MLTETLFGLPGIGQELVHGARKDSGSWNSMAARPPRSRRSSSSEARQPVSSLNPRRSDFPSTSTRATPHRL
ncbi:hypothetical protein ACWCQ0_21805 [Streptomyces massasporeus]|uniref:hypothetical protein n=1 Tax=Streptomyces massasporeus TaxID=67324 RepID=UPI003400BB95